MHPHTPPDRTEFESPEMGAARSPADRPMATGRNPSTAWAMLIAALVLAAVIAIVVVL